jgi:DNA-binding transcriptional regulator YiaG
MSSVVVCAEPRSLQQAGRFAAKLLGGAELKSFEELRREIPMQPVLVYLTHPDYDHLRSFLKFLKPTGVHVVIYYANRVAPTDAARLGKLVGETRPSHTGVVFEAKAAAQSVLQYSKSAVRKGVATASVARTRRLREHFALTQTELANAIGVSVRTVQNWSSLAWRADPVNFETLRSCGQSSPNRSNARISQRGCGRQITPFRARGPLTFSRTGRPATSLFSFVGSRPENRFENRAASARSAHPIDRRRCGATRRRFLPLGSLQTS